MLILLPLSESKSSPRRGKPLDLRPLSYPALDATRGRVLAALVELCQGDPEQARARLGQSTGQATDVSSKRAPAHGADSRGRSDLHRRPVRRVALLVRRRARATQPVSRWRPTPPDPRTELRQGTTEK